MKWQDEILDFGYYGMNLPHYISDESIVKFGDKANKALFDIKVLPISPSTLFDDLFSEKGFSNEIMKS